MKIQFIGATTGHQSILCNSVRAVRMLASIVVIALLLLLFGGAMATGAMMSGAMMGSGSMGSGSMGGIRWMWLSTLLVVVLGVVLFSIIFGKK